MFFRRVILTIPMLSLLYFAGYAQNPISPKSLNGSSVNAIETAVPFLTIAPDSRAGGMGDVGVATSPDVNSIHWNSAKLAFIKESAGVGLSYTPWLRNLVSDINLAYLSGYKRIDRQQVVAASLRYFALGEIIFTDENGNVLKPFNPNEFAIDAAYSRLFTDKTSGGIAFRFIRSDLTGQLSGDNLGGATKPGISFAADISMYHTQDVRVGDKQSTLSYGAMISNIGTKLSYTTSQGKEFIPINLRLGADLKSQLDDFNSLGFALDVNKLLVPTPPIYYNVGDTTSSGYVVKNNDKIIEFGRDPNVPVFQGMMQSFYDAPGGFREELQEWMISAGLEYTYRDQFIIRAGHFYEAQNKGNRKYFSVGVGLKLNVFSLDFAYLIPTTGRNNPLANTVRFTLSFLFDKNHKKASNV